MLDLAASGSLAELVAIAGNAERVVTVADAVRAGELGVRHLYAENDPSLLAEGAALGARGTYALYAQATSRWTGSPTHTARRKAVTPRASWSSLSGRRRVMRRLS